MPDRVVDRREPMCAGHRSVVLPFESEPAPSLTNLVGDDVWHWGRYCCSADCWYLRNA